MRCPITRNSAEIPFGAHGADFVCDSTGIFLTIVKELVIVGDPLVVDGQINAWSPTRKSAETPFGAHGASTRVSSSLVSELEVERLLGG